MRLMFWRTQSQKVAAMNSSRRKLITASESLEELSVLMKSFIVEFGKKQNFDLVYGPLCSTCVTLEIDYEIPESITGQYHHYEDLDLHHTFRVCSHFIHGKDGSKLASQLMGHINKKYFVVDIQRLRIQVFNNNNTSIDNDSAFI